MCGNMGYVTATTGAVAGVTSQQNRTINQIANRTRNLKKEQYRIINENGEIVIEKQGKEHEVAITLGEKREYMPGAVSIHNHPAGGTFSYPDLRDFGTGARQIVAASPEGTYKLTNTKYGKKDQYSGWHDMQQAMEKAGLLKERSYIDIRNEAQKAPKIAKLTKQITATSKEWVDARNAGKSKDVLDAITKKNDGLRADYKKALAAEIRTLETKPYHDFYKKNAKKYGFEYAFIKKK